MYINKDSLLMIFRKVDFKLNMSFFGGNKND